MRLCCLILFLVSVSLATVPQRRFGTSFLERVRATTETTVSARVQMSKNLARVGITMTPTEGLPKKIKWDQAEELGRGAFGVVFQACYGTFTKFCSKVGVKILIPTASKTLETLIEEVTKEGGMLKTLKSCAYVLNAKTAFIALKKDLPDAVQNNQAFQSLGPEDKVVGLVTDLMDAGNLKDRVKDMSNKQRYQVMKHFAKGLQCMQEKGYVHRDVKPDNLMLKWDGKQISGHVIDVGLAVTLEDAIAHCNKQTPKAAGAGTPGYMIPVNAGEENACDNAMAHFDEYSLGKTFSDNPLAQGSATPGCGAEKGGVKSVGLAYIMMNPPKDTKPRWDEIIKELTAGYKDVPEAVVDKYGILDTKVEDAIRASGYYLQAGTMGPLAPE